MGRVDEPKADRSTGLFRLGEAATARPARDAPSEEVARRGVTDPAPRWSAQRRGLPRRRPASSLRSPVRREAARPRWHLRAEAADRVAIWSGAAKSAPAGSVERQARDLALDHVGDVGVWVSADVAGSPAKRRGQPSRRRKSFHQAVREVLVVGDDAGVSGPASPAPASSRRATPPSRQLVDTCRRCRAGGRLLRLKAGATPGQEVGACGRRRAARPGEWSSPS